MTLRFRRRLKIFPGVTLNFSKSGVSTSVGVRGAHVTLGKTDRVTIGVPGTGLSDTEIIRKADEPKTGARAWPWGRIIFIAAIFAISWLVHSASA